MKRAVLFAIIAVLAAGLVITSGLAAQGPGRGQGARAAQLGLACPYGFSQPGGQQSGWWTRVQPATPQQKSFIGDVAKLHEQIRMKQLEIAGLRAANGSKADITRAQDGATALQRQLHDLMYQNRTLCLQMGGAGLGPGPQGRGAGARGSGGDCPYGYNRCNPTAGMRGVAAGRGPCGQGFGGGRGYRGGRGY